VDQVQHRDRRWSFSSLMVLFLRLGLLLLTSFRSVESAKAPKSQSLNLGDATLLVLDGMEDEGMKLAKELLAKESTKVNLEVEADDGSKGTPLAVAIHTMASPKAEDALGLIKLLVAHKDIDVNAALTSPVGSTMPPLLLAANAVTAGVGAGLEIANLLLAHESIKVNAATTGTSTLAPLHMALAAAARGSEAGVELVKALLARSDIDVSVKMKGPDGVEMTPLEKLAAMLLDKPGDANIIKLQGMLEGSKKDEL